MISANHSVRDNSKITFSTAFSHVQSSTKLLLPPREGSAFMIRQPIKSLPNQLPRVADWFRTNYSLFSVIVFYLFYFIACKV